MIYVVTEGEYSDYSICGVYETKEKAEYAQKLFGRGARIEEYELNAMPTHPSGMLRFSVTMDRDGNSECRHISVVDSSDFYDWSPDFDEQAVVFIMWARDEKHAVKISNDRRRRLIAENKWTTKFDEWAKIMETSK